MGPWRSIISRAKWESILRVAMLPWMSTMPGAPGVPYLRAGQHSTTSDCAHQKQTIDTSKEITKELLNERRAHDSRGRGPTTIGSRMFELGDKNGKEPKRET